MNLNATELPGRFPLGKQSIHDLTKDRPLDPYEISGFHNQHERSHFEKWAAKKGFSPVAVAKAETMTPEEWHCFNSMNEYRREHGRRPLHFSPRVKLISDQQAEYQAQSRTMTHNSPGLTGALPQQVERLKRVGLGRYGSDGWTHEGENAAFVPKNCARNPSEPEGRFVTREWLRSPGHLKPIQDNFLSIGAVSRQTSAVGDAYWTFNGSIGGDET